MKSISSRVLLSFLGVALATPVWADVPCDPSPRTTGCHLPAKALLLIKNDGDDSKDKVTWKWLKGAATTLGELGNPAGATTYALCVYDHSGFKFALHQTPGSRWSPSGSTGFEYGGDGTGDDGSRKLKLKSGAAGKAKMLALAAGLDVPLDSPGTTLPLALPATAQLINSAGECWSASFLNGTATTNTTTRFKSKLLGILPTPTAAPPTPTGTPTDTPTPAPKRIFVTSFAVNGSFVGLGVADFYCQYDADAAMLGGTYMAWLSSSIAPANVRTTHATVPYVLPTGTKVADDYADFTDGDLLDAPLDRGADGTLMAGVNAWTGSNADGTPVVGGEYRCDDWSSTLYAGEVASGANVDNGFIPCSSLAHFWCLEQ